MNGLIMFESGPVFDFCKLSEWNRFSQHASLLASDPSSLLALSAHMSPVMSGSTSGSRLRTSFYGFIFMALLYTCFTVLSGYQLRLYDRIHSALTSNVDIFGLQQPLTASEISYANQSRSVRHSRWDAYAPPTTRVFNWSER